MLVFVVARVNALTLPFAFSLSLVSGVYRVGQSKPVFLHKLLIKGSVEEDLYEMQQRKLSMAHGVMDGERRGAGSSAVAGAGKQQQAEGMSFKRKTAASGLSMAELKAIFLAKPGQQPRY